MMINEDFTKLAKLSDIGRWHITRFVRDVAASLPPGTSILDAGAGECVYKRYFDHCGYKSVDYAVGEAAWNYRNLDYVARLDALPMEDGCFDVVLCTQVLEHLEWPRESIQEIHRVMKPGGRLFLTAPMSHPEHQTPYDYFRFTSFGLKSICEKAGFVDVQIKPFGGMFTRWAYELPRILQVFPGTGFKSRKLNFLGIACLPLRASSFIMVRALQLALLFLDRLFNMPNDPFGWALVATKRLDS
jgi:SAM-dependent methyltransferase